MDKPPLESAYVLHVRAFQETSLIVEVLTRHHGRFSLIAKGAKRPKSAKAGLLQPFLPLTIAWVGRSELQTLTTIEARESCKRLQGNALMCGLYLNELLIKILDKHDAYPQVYDLYEQVLKQLGETEAVEYCLRKFELGLLKYLGYELSAQQLELEAYYLFTADNGFVKAAQSLESSELFRGSELFHILHLEYLSEESLPAAKRLMRIVFQSLLQGKSLNSRMLFIS